MYKIAVFSDAHLYSHSLGITGKAFELRSALDQRMLEESSAIIDAGIAEIIRQEPDCVLFAGDMTNNGETASHVEFREKIAELSKKIPVYVIYSTHDWCSDGNPRRFTGDVTLHDVESMTIEGLCGFYADFAQNGADSVFINGKGAPSYFRRLGDGMALIAVNDDYSGTGKAGYTPGHLDWILAQARLAKKEGRRVVMMEHHLVIAHTSPLVTSGMSIGDREKNVEALAAAGVDILLVGHSHMLNTTSYTAANGNVLTQINVGALTGYPAPIDWLTLNDDGSVTHDVEFLKGFTYNGTDYTLDDMKIHLENVLADMIRAAASDREEFCERFCSIGVSRSLASKVFIGIRPIAKKFLTISVGSAGKIINALTLGKGIRQDALEQVKDERLFDYVLTIFLNLFNGTSVRYPKGSPVYTIVRDLSTIPRRVINRIPGNRISTDICDKIEALTKELTDPSGPDNLHAVIVPADQIQK